MIDEQLDTQIAPSPRARQKQAIITVICILAVIILAVVCAVLIKSYVITTFYVDGISMYPTLDGGSGALSDSERENGEVLYLNKLAKLKRGDIVVFRPQWGLNDDNSISLVKRVIAIEGDHLQIISNVIYLNGKVLKEDYINGTMFTPDIDIYIEQGNMFCMGDNRNSSSDCRMFGQVSTDTVIGRCFLIKGLNNKIRKP